jgi:hypothetical protein
MAVRCASRCLLHATHFAKYWRDQFVLLYLSVYSLWSTCRKKRRKARINCIVSVLLSKIKTCPISIKFSTADILNFTAILRLWRISYVKCLTFPIPLKNISADIFWANAFWGAESPYVYMAISGWKVAPWLEGTVSYKIGSDHMIEKRIWYNVFRERVVMKRCDEKYF